MAFISGVIISTSGNGSPVVLLFHWWATYDISATANTVKMTEKDWAEKINSWGQSIKQTIKQSIDGTFFRLHQIRQINQSIDQIPYNTMVQLKSMENRESPQCSSLPFSRPIPNSTVEFCTDYSGHDNTGKGAWPRGKYRGSMLGRFPESTVKSRDPGCPMSQHGPKTYLDKNGRETGGKRCCWAGERGSGDPFFLP